MLARLFVFIGGLVVLALTLALVGPYFINWTSYRASFEREASAMLGRKVTVRGDVSARLLPFPSVSFSDISVAGGPAGEPAMTVETFSMDAELAPFMQGEFLIFDMRLVRPRMTIGIGENGAIDWAVRPSSPFDATQIALEKLTVTDGQVTIRHGFGGRDHVLSKINAEVSARSVAGPWRADGTLRLDGMDTAVTVSTGRVDETGTLRLRIKADPAVYPLAIEADGDIRLKDGAGLYAGSFRVDARAAGRNEPRGAAKPSSGQEPRQGVPVAGAPSPYRLNGKFALDHRRLEFQTLRFETGPLDNPYTADGSGIIELGAEPHFAIQADGAQLRFDENVAEAEKVSALTLESRLAALEQVLADLPKPTIPGSVDVRLPAVVAGDTTVRDVIISAEPAAEGWNMKSLAATLPGRTTLEANGLLRTQDGLGFQGSLLLAVGQPSGFAAWLSRDVDDAIRRLPAAGFKAKVDLTRQRQFFDDLELVLGNAKFNGAVDSRHPADANPTMAIKLDGDALDVDGLTAFASLFVSGQGMTQLAQRDLDLSVKAGPVSVAGLEAETVDTSLRLRGSQIEIDRLSIGGLEGATVSATGTLRDLPEKPSGKLDASIVAVDLAPLAKRFAKQFPDNALLAALATRAEAYAGLFEDTRIDVVGSADATSGLIINANGTAGASTFSLSGSGSAPLDPATPISISFSAANENAEALMALYGLPVLPLGAVGSADTKLTAKGTLGGGLDAALEFTAEHLTASYSGTLRQAEGLLEGEGKVALDADDIEPWLMTSGMAMPGMGLGLPIALAADASFGEGSLALSGLNGSVGEARLGGDVNATMKDGVPHLAGALTIETLDLWPVAAMVLGEESLQGEGNWPDTPFRNRGAAPFSADLELSAGSIAAGTFGTAENVTAAMRLDGEGLHISDFQGSAFGGTLTGLAELKNNGGTGLFSGQLKLAGADLGVLLEGSGITGHGDVAASLSASGKSAEAMVAALSGSGSVVFGGTSVPGINPNAFPSLLARADAVGRDIDAGKVEAFAPAIIGDGTFAAASGEAAFTVAGGVLRAPPLTLTAPAAKLTAELKADLNSGVVAVAGEIAYAAGNEALAGSEPAIRYSVEGPLGATRKHFDTEPLTQFLTQRALEIEQARVEAMQAALLERQRLRREVRYYAALQAERDRLVEEQRRGAEEARHRAEQERAKAETEARAAAEAKARAEAEAKAKAVAEAKAKAEEEARQRAFEERAAEAIRLVERERARAEAEARKPEVERAPLPAPGDSGVGQRFDPSSIDTFLRSLEETQ
ncbi:AsmA family protein [Mesorhizobium sp. 1B3]|uniref:AsmA family protein n=1 Tax=Mesorhizobium sp. 1B3 TaxID=3243599 RepID=UPI003D96E37C